MKRLLWLFGLGFLLMANPIPTTNYWVKVIAPSGTVRAAPLTLEGTPDDVQFTESKYVIGQSQNLGSFTVKLKYTQSPRWQYLRATYATLDYQDRIEAYDNVDLLGNPVFAGVITRKPGDLNKQEIAGVSSLKYLQDRKLRRYHTYTDTPTNIVKNLLKTYDVVFSDDFNRASLGSDWSVASGSWDISSGTLHCAAVGTLSSAATYTTTQWDHIKISFDLKLTAATNMAMNLQRNSANDRMQIGFSYSATDPEAFATSVISGGSIGIANRGINWTLSDSWNHVDVYMLRESTSMRVIMVLNGIELFNAVKTSFPSLDGIIQIILDTDSQIDNFIVSVATNAFQEGTIDSDATSITQTFNADNQLAALEWVCDYKSWEYRVRYRAGKGNDILDCGASVGTDYSATLQFEHTHFPNSSNPGAVVNLNIDRTGDDLATSLLVYGQTQDDATANFISNSIAQMTTYGIIERDYADPRVVDVSIAKIIGDNRLAVVAAGKVSLNGTLIDESKLTTLLHAADWVWLKSDTLNIDRKIQLVDITRQSGLSTLDFVGDYHGWSKTDLIAQFQRKLDLATREFINRMDTFHWQIVLPGGMVSVPLGVYFRGNYKTVYIDVLITVAGDGLRGFLMTVDGNSPTEWIPQPSAHGLEVPQAVDYITDIHITDTTRLVLSGKHTFTFVDNNEGYPQTLDIYVRPKMLS